MLTVVDLLWLILVFVIFDIAKVFCNKLDKKMSSWRLRKDDKDE